MSEMNVRSDLTKDVYSKFCNKNYKVKTSILPYPSMPLILINRIYDENVETAALDKARQEFENSVNAYDARLRDCYSEGVENLEILMKDLSEEPSNSRFKEKYPKWRDKNFLKQKIIEWPPRTSYAIFETTKENIEKTNARFLKPVRKVAPNTNKPVIF